MTGSLQDDLQGTAWCGFPSFLDVKVSSTKRLPFEPPFAKYIQEVTRAIKGSREGTQVSRGAAAGRSAGGSAGYVMTSRIKWLSGLLTNSHGHRVCRTLFWLAFLSFFSRQREPCLFQGLREALATDWHLLCLEAAQLMRNSRSSKDWVMGALPFVVSQAIFRIHADAFEEDRAQLKFHGMGIVTKVTHLVVFELHGFQITEDALRKERQRLFVRRVLLHPTKDPHGKEAQPTQDKKLGRKPVRKQPLVFGHRLVVHNVPREMGQSSLETVFAEYGEVLSVRIFPPVDQEPRTDALVEMAHADGCREAKEALNEIRELQHGLGPLFIEEAAPLTSEQMESLRQEQLDDTYPGSPSRASGHHADSYHAFVQSGKKLHAVSQGEVQRILGKHRAVVRSICRDRFPSEGASLSEVQTEMAVTSDESDTDLQAEELAAKARVNEFWICENRLLLKRAHVLTGSQKTDDRPSLTVARDLQVRKEFREQLLSSLARGPLPKDMAGVEIDTAWVSPLVKALAPSAQDRNLTKQRAGDRYYLNLRPSSDSIVRPASVPTLRRLQQAEGTNSDARRKAEDMSATCADDAVSSSVVGGAAAPPQQRSPGRPRSSRSAASLPESSAIEVAAPAPAATIASFASPTAASLRRASNESGQSTTKRRALSETRANPSTKHPGRDGEMISMAPPTRLSSAVISQRLDHSRTVFRQGSFAEYLKHFDPITDTRKVEAGDAKQLREEEDAALRKLSHTPIARFIPISQQGAQRKESRMAAKAGRLRPRSLSSTL